MRNTAVVLCIFVTVSLIDVITGEEFQRMKLSVSPNERVQQDVNTRNNDRTTNPCDLPAKPDFSAPGRRISEIKCDEYIWQMYNRIEARKRLNDCLEYNRVKNHDDGILGIIGGRDTSPGEFAHMGAIGWKEVTGDWIFKCGSSLISEKFVLTAGHCISASSKGTALADPIPKIVRLGTKNINPIGKKDYLLDVNIYRIIPHPQYASPKKYYDIALMELENEVTFSKYLQPACLWSNFDTSSLGTKANITGWGITTINSHNTSAELQVAEVSFIDIPQCSDLLKYSCNRNWCKISDHQLCAGKLSGGVDSCQGDSGGPLQVLIPLNTTEEGMIHYVVGVTSFGFHCAKPNTPSIYSRVSSFIDWIEINVWNQTTKT